MTDHQTPFPTAKTIHMALDIYLRHAWETPISPAAEAQLPPAGDFDVLTWIMGELIERDPPGEPSEKLRSAAFRLGNTFYPNMKFRMSLPPGGVEYLFSVDSHDAVLQAPEGTADHAMLEELKAHNKQLGETIQREWDEAGLPT
ncbi:MAG: hypothetical protein HN909_06610, partial [Phycisphaerales bacterium]|nr:hypothetical protein [Phycisphaerales bacterium]